MPHCVPSPPWAIVLQGEKKNLLQCGLSKLQFLHGISTCTGAAVWVMAAAPSSPGATEESLPSLKVFPAVLSVLLSGQLCPAARLLEAAGTSCVGHGAATAPVHRGSSLFTEAPAAPCRSLGTNTQYTIKPTKHCSIAIRIHTMSVFVLKGRRNFSGYV